MDWNALVSALGLVLVIEGLLPALSPRRSRETFSLLSQLPESTLRRFGVAGLVVGIIILNVF